ncbi:MAG: histidine triad nucleotide-binding protein [Bdellovibrionales bacterium]
MSIFTKIINREIPAKIVFEDDLCLAFRDISPQAPEHILLIPKKEIRSLNEASSEDQKLLGHMLIQVAAIAKKLGFAEDGYRVVINTNGDGGQTVFHLHLHLLAGRQLTWPPG